MNALSRIKAMVCLVASLLFFSSPSVAARDVRTVEGSSVYVVPRSVSLEEAENIALQRAITDALAAEFGTTVQSEVWLDFYNSNDESSAEAWMNGLNMVKGEWLETIGQPEITLDLSQEGYLVKVRVKGRAAAIESAGVDLKAGVLQAGARGISDGSKFTSGNRLLVEFASPVNGYLAIFLADAASNVVQLLPFAAETAPATPVKGGKKYTFFADNSGEVEEQYTLFTEEEKERNILYIIFSTKEFTRPNTDLSAGVGIIGADAFRKWLLRRRSSDPSMQTIIQPILIRKQ